MMSCFCWITLTLQCCHRRHNRQIITTTIIHCRNVLLKDNQNSNNIWRTKIPGILLVLRGLALPVRNVFYHINKLNKFLPPQAMSIPCGRGWWSGDFFLPYSLGFVDSEMAKRPIFAWRFLRHWRQILTSQVSCNRHGKCLIEFNHKNWK